MRGSRHRAVSNRRAHPWRLETRPGERRCGRRRARLRARAWQHHRCRRNAPRAVLRILQRCATLPPPRMRSNDRLPSGLCRTRPHEVVPCLVCAAHGDRGGLRQPDQGTPSTLPSTAPPAEPPRPGQPPPNVLAAEVTWLKQLFDGTPVAIASEPDGSMRVDVPMTFSFDDKSNAPKPPLRAVMDKVAVSMARQASTKVHLATPGPAARGAAMRSYLQGRGVIGLRVVVLAPPSGRCRHVASWCPGRWRSTSSTTRTCRRRPTHSRAAARAPNRRRSRRYGGL